MESLGKRYLLIRITYSIVEFLTLVAIVRLAGICHIINVIFFALLSIWSFIDLTIKDRKFLKLLKAFAEKDWNYVILHKDILNIYANAVDKVKTTAGHLAVALSYFNMGRDAEFLEHINKVKTKARRLVRYNTIREYYLFVYELITDKETVQTKYDMFCQSQPRLEAFTKKAELLMKIANKTITQEELSELMDIINQPRITKWIMQKQ